MDVVAEQAGLSPTRSDISQDRFSHNKAQIRCEQTSEVVTIFLIGVVPAIVDMVTHLVFTQAQAVVTAELVSTHLN